VWAVQLVGHSVDVPEQRYGAHEGLPAFPAAAGAQTPSVTAPSTTEQASHPLAHAVSQQTPLEQKPLAQWDAMAHDAPCGCLGTHCSLMQICSLMQSVSLSQDAGQSADVAEQR